MIVWRRLLVRAAGEVSVLGNRPVLFSAGQGGQLVQGNSVTDDLLTAVTTLTVFSVMVVRGSFELLHSAQTCWC